MKNLILLATLLFSQLCLASITTATSSGDWTEASVCDNGIPGCFDTIVIPFGVQVDITSTQDLEGCADSILVLIEGRLEFQNGKKLKLPCLSDVLVYPGGSVGVGSGGGASTYIEICSTQYWNAGQGDLTGPTSLCDGQCPVFPWTLPIELLFFEAEMDEPNRKVNLRWATASEVDNDYFTVERSNNGVDWIEVLQVDGAGTKTTRTDYADVDMKPYSGVSYYRLKQTDFDGAYTYSPIVSVNSGTADQLSIYPNPSNQGDQVVIIFPDYGQQMIDVQIFTAAGKIVYQRTVDLFDSRQLILDLDSQFESGLYIIRTEHEVSRLIVK